MHGVRVTQALAAILHVEAGARQGGAEVVPGVRGHVVATAEGGADVVRLRRGLRTGGTTLTELTDDEREARMAEIEELQARIVEIRNELKADRLARRERGRAEGVET